MLKKHAQFFEALFTASDLLVVSASWVLSYWVRFSWNIIPVEKGIPPFSDYLKMLLFLWLIWAFVFRRFGLYQADARREPGARSLDADQGEQLQCAAAAGRYLSFPRESHPIFPACLFDFLDGLLLSDCCSAQFGPGFFADHAPPGIQSPLCHHRRFAGDRRQSGQQHAGQSGVWL